ncbi:MAG: hypothetical protein H6704_29090 [Myxococcales bacterium]|nr:hypothetical protein [Myxococcales bacterium]
MTALGWRPPDPPLPVVSFVDLDDTLFRSPARGGHGRPVTVTRAGQPYSYMSPPQQQLFAMLRAAGRVIPTTARSPAQLARVHLPFDDYAICSHGAVVLQPDGAPCPVWRAEVRARVAALKVGAAAVMRRAREQPGGEALRVEFMEVEGSPLFVSVREPKRRHAPITAWAEHMRAALPAGWLLESGRDRALLHPASIDKAAAVRWFVDHHALRPALLLGAGDRHGDADFMAACDYALLPVGSHLFDCLGGGR